MRCGDVQVGARPDTHRNLHGGLDRAAAYLTVALRRVTVTYGEERAIYANWQEEGCPGRQVADVEVPAERGRREDGVRPRSVWHDADRAGERPAGHGDAVGVPNKSVLDLGDPQPRVRE